jgi:hypothetical protein
MRAFATLLPLLTTGFGLGVGYFIGAIPADRAPAGPNVGVASLPNPASAPKTRVEVSLAAGALGAARPSVVGLAPAPGKISTRVETLEGRAAEAFQAKKGADLLPILTDLAKVGRPGFPLTVRLVEAISRAADAGAPVDENAFRRILASPTFRPLLEEALADPQHYGAAFRRLAASELAATGDVQAFAGLLQHEPDPLVAKTMAATLGQSHDSKNVGPLVAALSSQPNRGVQLAIVGALAATPGDVATNALESLATSGPDASKTAAKNELVARKPPVNGLLVTYVAPRSAADLAGLAPGDLLTAFNGNPFSTFDGLALLQGNAPAGVVITLSLLRGGAVCQALVRNGQQLGIDGHTVEVQTP